MDKPQPANIATVALVESNSRPGGVQLVNTHSTNKNADPMDLVELAQTIQKADEFTKATAGSKLTEIANQIKYLQERARKVLEQAQRDNKLHHYACNIVKKPGTIYYLYERDSGQKYMSILSPEEWGASLPHLFLGAYKLEHDQSWTPIAEMEERGEQFALIDKIFHAQNALTNSPSPNFSGLTNDGSSGFK